MQHFHVRVCFFFLLTTINIHVFRQKNEQCVLPMCAVRIIYGIFVPNVCTVSYQLAPYASRTAYVVFDKIKALLLNHWFFHIFILFVCLSFSPDADILCGICSIGCLLLLDTLPVVHFGDMSNWNLTIGLDSPLIQSDSNMGSSIIGLSVKRETTHVLSYGESISFVFPFDSQRIYWMIEMDNVCVCVCGMHLCVYLFGWVVLYITY